MQISCSSGGLNSKELIIHFICSCDFIKILWGTHILVLLVDPVVSRGVSHYIFQAALNS